MFAVRVEDEIRQVRIAHLQVVKYGALANSIDPSKSYRPVAKLVSGLLQNLQLLSEFVDALAVHSLVATNSVVCTQIHFVAN